MRRRLPLVFLSLAVLTACGGGAGHPSAAGHHTARPTARPTATPKPGPTAAAVVKGQWTKLALPAFNPQGLPSFPPGELLALDPVTSEVIATIPEYGDGQPESYNESTWVWSNNTWTELLSQSPFDDCTLMTSDSTGVLCLSEPQDDDAVDDFTAWNFNGSAWVYAGGTTNGAPVDSINGSDMAYDPVTQQDVFYNGSKTWVWNGTAWSEPKTSVKPDASGAVALAFDPLSNSIILIGSDYSGDTLQARWTGTNWKMTGGASTEPLTSSNSLMGFVTDPVTGLMLLSVQGNTQTTTSTYVWNGLRWVSQSPAKQTLTAMAPDPASKEILAVDQTNHLWVWTAVAPS